MSRNHNATYRNVSPFALLQVRGHNLNETEMRQFLQFYGQFWRWVATFLLKNVTWWKFLIKNLSSLATTRHMQDIHFHPCVWVDKKESWILHALWHPCRRDQPSVHTWQSSCSCTQHTCCEMFVCSPAMYCTVPWDVTCWVRACVRRRLYESDNIMHL